MTARHFVDTNVLVYARDNAEPAKQRAALAWLEFLWRERAGRISMQVLSEFYVCVTAKLRPGLPPAQAWHDVEDLLVWDPLSLNRAVLDRAFHVQNEFKFAWWDALIVAAAQLQHCAFLLTEDMQAGQNLGGVHVINPFAVAPGAATALLRRQRRARG